MEKVYSREYGLKSRSFDEKYVRVASSIHQDGLTGMTRQRTTSVSGVNVPDTTYAKQVFEAYKMLLTMYPDKLPKEPDKVEAENKEP